MSTTVRLPNGQEIDIQTSDPKAAAAAARRYYAAQSKQAPSAPKPQARKPLGAWGTAKAFAGDVVDNILPNMGDELAGAASWAGAALTGKPSKAAFKHGQREFKANQRQYDEENPNLSWASTGLGFAGGLLIPAGGAVKAANLAGRGISRVAPRLAQRGANAGRTVASSNAVRGVGRLAGKAPPSVRNMGKGAAIGASYGAVGGLAEQEGEGRLANAATGAVAGGIGGAAIQPVLHGATTVGRAVRNHVPMVDRAASAVSDAARVPINAVRTSFGASPLTAPVREPRANIAADRFLARQMDTGQIASLDGTIGTRSSPDAIVAEVRRRQELGVPAMAGDVTGAMRATAGAASRGIGPAQQLVRDSVNARKLQENNRVSQHIVDELGEVVDPILQAEQVVARAKRNADPTYTEAYNQPMVITPEIETLMRNPAFREAVPTAIRNMRLANIDPQGLGFRIFQHGENRGGKALTEADHEFPEGLGIEAYRGLTTEGFDRVSRAMRENAIKAADKNPITNRPIHTFESGAINARANDLREEIGKHNEAYKGAVANYGDEMNTRDALNYGAEFNQRSAHEIAAQRRAMPEQTHGDWALGARSSLHNAAMEYGAKHPTGNTAKHITGLMGDERKLQQLGEMGGNTGGVRRLQQRLEAEHQGNMLWKEVEGNSATSQRMEAHRELEDAAGRIPVTGVSVPTLMRNLADYTASKLRPQYMNTMKERIAKIVTETNPDTLEDLMKQIAARAEVDGNFRELVTKSGFNIANIMGRNVAYGDGTTIDDDETPIDVMDYATAEELEYGDGY